MKRYFLKFDGREQGPYSASQVAQMFADGQVNRSTPCKLETGGDWRTIDEHMPTLKYGSQLPPPTSAPAITLPARSPGVLGVNQSVSIIDVDVPFSSVLKMAFKIGAAWLIVAVAVMPIMLIFWFLVLGGIISFFTQALSGLHH